MLNLVSIIIGLVALVCAAIAFIPLLGWANWLIIPLAVIGAGIGAASAAARRAQPQPVRDRRRHHPPDARRGHHLSRDARIDAYIAKAAPFAQPILDHVRARVHAVVPTVEETLKWSAPAFTVDGKILLIMAAFKAHAALNFWRGQELGDGAPKAGAMGQFGKLTSARRPAGRRRARRADRAKRPRWPRPRPPRARSSMSPSRAPSSTPISPPRSTPIPPAKATLDGFSPSARRDYLDWIARGQAGRHPRQAHRHRGRMAARRQEAPLEI